MSNECDRLQGIYDAEFDRYVLTMRSRHALPLIFVLARRGFQPMVHWKISVLTFVYNTAQEASAGRIRWGKEHEMIGLIGSKFVRAFGSTSTDDVLDRIGIRVDERYCTVGWAHPQLGALGLTTTPFEPLTDKP